MAAAQGSDIPRSRTLHLRARGARHSAPRLERAPGVAPPPPDGGRWHPPGAPWGRRRPPLPREPFPLVFRRDGSLQEIVLPPVKLTPWQRLRVLLLPLAAVVAAPLVAFALVWRRP